MTFTDEQLRKLKSPVRREHVKAREIDGKTLHYLEGWRVVSEANRIFGFDAWERETVSSECVWRSPVENRFGAAYLTRVRIKVRAGEHLIVREGLGAGEAIALTPGQAHERASKAAETDATKRALSTFGSRFGLSLYGERDAKAPGGGAIGTVAARAADEEGHRIRQQPSKIDPQPLRAQIKDTESRSVGGPHPFVRGPVIPSRDQVVDGVRGSSAQPGSTKRDNTLENAAIEQDKGEVAYVPVHLPGRVDKSVLTLSEPRRLRNRHHLKFVARQPCLACGRTPSQAHHLRIAQPRALGRKVSDEFTVPLCALHHHDLHMHGNETAWWAARKIDPLPAAQALWSSRGDRDHSNPLQCPEVTSGSPQEVDTGEPERSRTDACSTRA